MNRAVKHFDIRFAGTSDEDLIQAHLDYCEYEDTGFLDDGALRQLSRKFGGELPVHFIATALYTYREIARRKLDI